MDPYYSDDSVTLYHGDSTEIMDELICADVLADLVITDPPYVIGAVSAGSLGAKSGGWQDMMNSASWFTAWYRQAYTLLRHSGAMWAFCNWRSVPVVMRAATDAGIPLTSMMVWDKEWIGPGGSQGLRPAYELCGLFAKPDFAIPDRGVPDVWRHKTGGYKPNGHPAEKPVDLMRRIIRTSGNAGLVLDPFAGSGTTLVAAKAEGVRAIGIEAEEKWCEVAANRLMQDGLFSVSESAIQQALMKDPLARGLHETGAPKLARERAERAAREMQFDLAEPTPCNCSSMACRECMTGGAA